MHKSLQIVINGCIILSEIPANNKRTVMLRMYRCNLRSSFRSMNLLNILMKTNNGVVLCTQKPLDSHEAELRGILR